MSTISAATKTNGRSARNAVPSGGSKRSSRSVTPNQDITEKIEKHIQNPTTISTKSNQQTEKNNAIKLAVVEEINKSLEDKTTNPVAVSTPKSNKITDETINESLTSEINKEKTSTDLKEPKRENSEAKANGGNSEPGNENGAVEIGTEQAKAHEVKEAKTEETSAVFEIMDEPILTLSEDDEKSSLHDSFDVECTFENGSPTFSPVANRSVTRRSQTKNLPTPESPKVATKDNVLAKASPSNGTNDEESVIVDDSASESQGETEVLHAEEDVSSSDARESVQSSRISPFRRSTRLMENASLIANYSGSTGRDLSIGESNTNGSDYNDDSLNATHDGADASRNYGRSLRNISGRRNVRPLREVSFRNVKKQMDASRFKGKDDTQTSMNVTVGTDLSTSISSRNANKSLKRERSTTPNNQEDESKRFKTDGYIMGYIPSPMTALRRRFSTSGINCSTPKRAASTIEIDLKTVPVQKDIEKNKNWCSIM